MKENKPSILIAEDDPNICETLSMVLEQEGYNVKVARNGREALKILGELPFEIVLLDIKLPDIDGIEVLRSLNEVKSQSVKIIITGYPSLENAIEALNLKADAYLIKPVKVEKLLTTIKEKLEQQHKENEVTEEMIKRWIKTRVQKLMKADVNSTL